MNADCKTAFGAMKNHSYGQQNNGGFAGGDAGLSNLMRIGVDLRLRIVDVESGTGVYRIVQSVLVGWRSRILPAPDRRARTAHQPGLMLALKRGGRTTGVAYRLPEDAGAGTNPVVEAR